MARLLVLLLAATAAQGALRSRSIKDQLATALEASESEWHASPSTTLPRYKEAKAASTHPAHARHQKPAPASTMRVVSSALASTVDAGAAPRRSEYEETSTSTQEASFVEEAEGASRKKKHHARAHAHSHAEARGESGAGSADTGLSGASGAAPPASGAEAEGVEGAQHVKASFVLKGYSASTFNFRTESTFTIVLAKHAGVATDAVGLTAVQDKGGAAAASAPGAAKSLRRRRLLAADALTIRAFIKAPTLAAAAAAKDKIEGLQEDARAFVASLQEAGLTDATDISVGPVTVVAAAQDMEKARSLPSNAGEAFGRRYTWDPIGDKVRGRRNAEEVLWPYFSSAVPPEARVSTARIGNSVAEGKPPVLPYFLRSRLFSALSVAPRLR